jgi:hypothetical protein
MSANYHLHYVIVLVFVLTAMVFILYEHLVQKRHDKVMATAEAHQLLRHCSRPTSATVCSRMQRRAGRARCSEQDENGERTLQERIDSRITLTKTDEGRTRTNQSPICFKIQQLCLRISKAPPLGALQGTITGVHSPRDDLSGLR